MTTLTSPAYAIAAAMALAMMASSPARADDADIDVPGPVGRSSVSTTGSLASSRNDNEWFGFGASGQSTNRLLSKALSVSGTWAAHERVDLEASVGRSVVRIESSGQGHDFTSRDGANAASVGLSARVLGTPLGEGFGLVLGAHASHTEGSDSNSYLLSALPLYRFDPRWIAGASLDLYRFGDVRTQYWGAMVQWKVTPSLSLTPSVTYSRTEANGPIPAYHGVSSEVTAVYHFNSNLSVAGSVQAGHTSDVSTSYQRLSNQRSASLSAGVRWTF